LLRKPCKKVLLLHPSDSLYGADRVLLQVLEAIRGRVEPIVVLPRDVAPGPLTSALMLMGVTTIRVRVPVLRRRYFQPLGLAQLAATGLIGVVELARIGRAERVVAVHTNTAAILVGPLVSWLLGVPHVWHVHEIVHHPAWLGHIIVPLTRWQTQRVIAISRAVAVSLVSNGGRVTDIWRNPAPDSSALSPMTWSNPVVLMAGRVNGWKGHDVFVRAAARLHRDLPGVVFRIVGGPVLERMGPYESLREDVKRLDARGEWLQLVGWTDDMATEILRAIAVVLPSTAPEGLNITALEAMASGRVVVASRAGGLPEVVVDQVTGLLTPAGDEIALAAAIRRVMEDPELAERLARAGRERAITMFGWETYRKRWDRLYERLVRPDSCNCNLVRRVGSCQQ
jgi:glycosyltransferase involved in cell wall biosynthesis